MTTNSWLNVFLQLAENMDHDTFVVPQYSAHNFVQLARVRIVTNVHVVIIKYEVYLCTSIVGAHKPNWSKLTILIV